MTNKCQGYFVLSALWVIAAQLGRLNGDDMLGLMAGLAALGWLGLAVRE